MNLLYCQLFTLNKYYFWPSEEGGFWGSVKWA